MNKKIVASYQTSSSRDPIWTQVSCQPEDNLILENSRHGRTQRVKKLVGVIVISVGIGITRTYIRAFYLLTAAGENPQVHADQPAGDLNLKGISVLATAVLIAGEMAGSGVLALPRAVVDTGWVGVILVMVFCCCAAYSGSCLGECWCIIEERYHQHRGKTRNPYATIAYAACGPWASRLVSCCIQITLFGAGTVYLLLASQVAQDMLISILPQISFCVHLLLIAVALCPAMWLGSPKDFWAVGVGAVMTTALSCICIFSKMLIDSAHPYHTAAPEASSTTEKIDPQVHTFHKLFLAFGTMLFAFGGASTFPTIQNDMREKNRFSTSIVIGFSVIMALYLPVIIGGFIMYGDKVDENILVSLSRGLSDAADPEEVHGLWLVDSAYILMGAHLILAFLIVVNPVCQEVEELLHVPHNFGWRRCTIRTGLVVAMVIVGESVPHFGKLLALVGGSTVTLLTFILPPLFYMRLCDQQCPLTQRRRSSSAGTNLTVQPMWPKRFIPLHVRVFLWELIFVGIIGGSASTYSAITGIFGAGSITKPCYIP